MDERDKELHDNLLIAEDKLLATLEQTHDQGENTRKNIIDVLKLVNNAISTVKND